MRSIFAAIRSVPRPLHSLAGEQAPPIVPFVTISREAGAGGHTVGQLLIERLNQLDRGEPLWRLWDKQLVEKVTEDHHLSREVVESLDACGRSWMQEFLAGLSYHGNDTEAKAYQRVATTIRFLAQHGRAVIVGRGGVFITRNIPGGVHVRLIAPLEKRINTMARQLGVNRDAAAEHVRNLDRGRQAFFRRYWPKEVISEQAFTLIVNTAQVDERRAVEAIIALLAPDLRGGVS